MVQTLPSNIHTPFTSARVSLTSSPYFSALYYERSHWWSQCYQAQIFFHASPDDLLDVCRLSGCIHMLLLPSCRKMPRSWPGTPGIQTESDLHHRHSTDVTCFSFLVEITDHSLRKPEPLSCLYQYRATLSM